MMDTTSELDCIQVLLSADGACDLGFFHKFKGQGQFVPKHRQEYMTHAHTVLMRDEFILFCSQMLHAVKSAWDRKSGEVWML